MKVLIDTNVILDAMLSRSPFNEFAQHLFIMAAKNKIEACITASSITDIHYLLYKHIHDETECRQILLKLFTLFDITDVTGSDCEKALKLPMLDYEDALVATCAKRHKVEWIITRNQKDFVHSPIKSITPDEFLANLK